MIHYWHTNQSRDVRQVRPSRLKTLKKIVFALSRFTFSASFIVLCISNHFFCFIQGKILQVSRGIECRDLREPLGVVACCVVSDTEYVSPETPHTRNPPAAADAPATASVLWGENTFVLIRLLCSFPIAAEPRLCHGTAHTIKSGKYWYTGLNVRQMQLFRSVFSEKYLISVMENARERE